MLGTVMQLSNRTPIQHITERTSASLFRSKDATIQRISFEIHSLFHRMHHLVLLAKRRTSWALVSYWMYFLYAVGVEGVWVS